MQVSILLTAGCTMRSLSFLALSLSTLVACVEAPADDDSIDDGKSDQISGRDDPSGLLKNAERKFSKLVPASDVGQQILVPEERTPYPDTYWPMVDNGVAGNWLNKDGTRCEVVAAPQEQGGGLAVHQCTDPAPSPLEKLVALTDPGSVADAIAWEKANHGKELDGVLDWFGHCPGWVASSLLNGPVQGAVDVKFDGTDIVKCAPGESGCTRFEIGDINAVSAEAHEGADSRFIGARCDTDPSKIERDEFGRIVRNGSGCKGLNPGTMVIILGNQVKMNGLPFAIDAQQEFTTNQIWNQPAAGYSLNKLEEVTEAEAANLVASGGKSRTGDHDDYTFNSKAKGFALVDFSLHWVTEHGPNLTPFSGRDSLRTTRMVAIVELDAAMSDPDATVIGGEYLDDESVGANRLRNAPFAWLAVGMGDDFNHNPFVKGRLVQQLVDIGVGK